MIKLAKTLAEAQALQDKIKTQKIVDYVEGKIKK